MARTIGLVPSCHSCVEVKSLADDRVRTGVCKLLSNLCCYELLSTSGFLRFDPILPWDTLRLVPPRGVSWTLRPNQVCAMTVVVPIQLWKSVGCGKAVVDESELSLYLSNLDVGKQLRELSLYLSNFEVGWMWESSCG